MSTGRIANDEEVLAEIVPNDPPLSDPLFDRIQAIQNAAVALDTEIRTSPVSLVFRAAWWAWLDHWTRFFRRHALQGLWERSADETLASQVDGYASDLESWHLTYQGEQERALARPTVNSEPLTVGSVGEDKDKSFLPWWAWALGGAAVAGGAYLTYKKAAAYIPNLKAARDALLSVPSKSLPTPTEIPGALLPFSSAIAAPAAPPAILTLRAPEPQSLGHALPSLLNAAGEILPK